MKSPSLPESMEGIKAIIIGVDELTEEDAQRYHVIYRMDGETPIMEGEDILADEYLEDENIVLGWDGRSHCLSRANT